MMGNTGCLVRLVTDRTGTAAVEFALIMPLFATLFFGTFEVANLLLADMKLTATAQAAADLAARAPSSPNASDVAEMTDAVALVMTSLPTATQLKIAYAGVTFDKGASTIDWHYETNGASAITTGTLPNRVDLRALGSAESGASDSLIVVRVQYSYTSPLSYVLARTWDLSEAAFARPR